MPDRNDYLILGERDYKICLLAEKEIPDEIAEMLHIDEKYCSQGTV